jgi:hypothetical protein
MTVEITGAKETLRALGKVEPEMRKQFTRDAKKIAKPIVDLARAKYPTKYLSGMFKTWAPKGRVLFPYSQSKAQRGVQARVSSARKKNYLLAVVQKDPAAAIVDMAGKKTRGKIGPGSTPGERFVYNLFGDFGNPSRVMWPAAEARSAAVERELSDLIDQVSVRVGSEMRKY